MATMKIVWELTKQLAEWAFVWCVMLPILILAFRGMRKEYKDVTHD
jgi:thiamine transporter ThiT